MLVASDLHFGANDPDVIARFRHAVLTDPDRLLVVAGDLTQDHKPAEYAAARDTLCRIPPNHRWPFAAIRLTCIRIATTKEPTMSILDPLKREKTLEEKLRGWVRGDFSSKTLDPIHAVGKVFTGTVKVVENAQVAAGAVKVLGEVNKILSKNI